MRQRHRKNGYSSYQSYSSEKYRQTSPPIHHKPLPLPRRGADERRVYLPQLGLPANPLQGPRPSRAHLRFQPAGSASYYAMQQGGASAHGDGVHDLTAQPAADTPNHETRFIFPEASLKYCQFENMTSQLADRPAKLSVGPKAKVRMSSKAPILSRCRSP